MQFLHLLYTADGMRKKHKKAPVIWMPRKKSLKNKISQLHQNLHKQIATEALNKACVLRLSQNLDRLITLYMKH